MRNNNFKWCNKKVTPFFIFYPQNFYISKNCCTFAADFKNKSIMPKKGEKILTRNRVEKLGLDKVSVITADMLDGYTSIEDYAFLSCSGLAYVTIPNSVTSIGNSAFFGCSGLTSITIPNSVTSIGEAAFYNCKGLESLTIGDKEYKKQKVKDGKCKAYKAFNAYMTCLDFKYKEGETYEFDGKPVLCLCGFHACLNLTDVFSYYYGKIGKDIVVHEVELEGVNIVRHYDSKVVAKKITIGKRIL